MKYTDDEALSEILRRSDVIVRKRGMRSVTYYSGAALVLAAVLIYVIAAQPGRSTALLDNSAYGSLMLTPETGGYVLAALIAFALGVVATLIYLHRRKSGDKKKERM